MADRSMAFTFLGRDRGASRTFRRIGDEADRAQGRISNFAAGLAGGALAAGLVSFGKNSVEAFKESEQSAIRLDQAFAKFPKLADTNRAALDGLSESLAKKTKYDDDATASAQATLAQFGLTGKQIETLTPLVQDYASKTGKDLSAAAEAVGKATMGQGKALKDVGLNLKDAGSQGKNFDNVMQGLRAQVGGFAQAEGATASGQSAILANQFGEIQETVGAKLVPALASLAAVLLTVVEFIQRNGDAISIVVGVVGTLAGGLFIATKVVAAFNAVAIAMGSSMTIALGPVGLIIIAIAALVAGLVIAYKRSETFRNIVNKAFDGIKQGASFLKDAVIGYFQLIANIWLTVVGVLVGGAAKAFGWVPGIGPKLKTAAEEFGKFKDTVNSTLDGLKDQEIKIGLDTRSAQQKKADLFDSGTANGAGGGRRVTGGTGDVYLDGKKVGVIVAPGVTNEQNKNAKRGAKTRALR